MKKIVIIGPNGSGKSSLAAFVAKLYGLPHISCGDALRNISEYPEIQSLVGDYSVHSGALMDDQTLVTLVSTLIAHRGTSEGWVIDGTPRRPLQAMRMLAEFPPTHVIILRASLTVIEQRIGNRRYDLNARKVYRLGIDEIPDGAVLTTRPDDDIDIIRRRYAIYEAETAPTIRAIQTLINRYSMPILGAEYFTDFMTPTDVENQAREFLEREVRWLT